MQISNSTVLITGASRGIGLALAQQMAQKNAHLILAMRTCPADLVEDLKKRGALSVEFVKANLQSFEGIVEFCQHMEQQNRQVDILINNAGQLTGGLLESQSIEDIYNMMQVNLLATIHLTHFFLPKMIAHGRGKVINNASVSGKMFFPCASTYAASKAGVVGFTESLIGELKGTGVSVLLLITPGVKTDMFDEIAHQYGKNMDLSFMSSMPPDDWAVQVIKAVENDVTHVWPSGATGVGVWVGHHIPKMFRWLTSSKFKR